MDAVELGYPVDVPKLMGSEGFGRARVTVNEVNPTACESNACVSILVNTSIERCSTLLRTKDVASTVNNSEPASWDKIPESELCKHESQLPSHEDTLEQLHSRTVNCPSLSSRPEVVHVKPKARKVSRSSSGWSKRQRLAQLEDNTCSDGVDEINDMYDNLGPKCNSIEKTQVVKQKHNSCGKRGDKRNLKVLMKAKFESFSVKAGLASGGSAAGGNNFLGIYSLKSDFNDITKHLDDMSLKDLLDGTYECPSLGKDKGKKTANSNENFIHSVRKACTILPLAKPARSQNSGEVDSGTNKKLPLCPPSSISLSSSGDNGEKGDSCTTNLSSCDKESCSKPDLLDFSLFQPKDILERLALPTAKDLDALLLDAAKPSAPSRTNSDIRSGKQISRRASLPPFPWSHTFNGHCRTNSDAVKLLTSRSTCHGRWATMATKTTSLGASADYFTNLESLTYDQSLVPVSTSISRPWFDWWSSSLATCSKASVGPESGINPQDQVKAEHCPKVIVAAQTLCSIATQFMKRAPSDGIMKWPKKTSQKVMKAKKTKLFEKHDVFTTQISQLASDSFVRIDQISTSKRRKLMIENGKDLNHINAIKKGPINWSTPRSSRSSPNRTVTDKITGPRHSTANISGLSCIMPSPSKMFDKASNSQQKLRKLMATRWDRGRDRVD